MLTTKNPQGSPRNVHKYKITLTARQTTDINMLSTQTRNNSAKCISIIQNKLESHDLFSHS